MADKDPKPDPRDVFPPLKEGQFKEEDVVLSSETIKFLTLRCGNLVKVKGAKASRSGSGGSERNRSDRIRIERNSPEDGRGCQLCVMILEDFVLHGKLTGWPLDNFEKGVFPVEAKVRHIELERYGS